MSQNNYSQHHPDENKSQAGFPPQLPPPSTAQYAPPTHSQTPLNPYDHYIYNQMPQHMKPNNAYYQQPGGPLRPGILGHPATPYTHLAPPGPPSANLVPTPPARVKPEEPPYHNMPYKQASPSVYPFHPSELTSTHSGENAEERPAVGPPNGTKWILQQPERPPPLETTPFLLPQGFQVPTQSVSGQAPSPAVLRKRSLTACDTCRQKKIKCDNMRPRCGACTRNGIMNCNYRSDTSITDFDPASMNIMNKLDRILNEIRGNKSEPAEDSEPKRRKLLRKLTRGVQFQHCLWDMSITTMFNWSYLQKILETNDDDAALHTKKLIELYEQSNLSFPFSSSFQERYEVCAAVEEFLHTQISQFTNSFLLNCHSKVPCLDVVSLLESLEIYTLLKRSDPLLTFESLLEDFGALKPTELVGKLYLDAITKFDIEDSPVRHKAYRNLCESVPLLLVICAIGALSTHVRLDNIGQYENSLQEREDPKLCCADLEPTGPLIPKDRLRLSQMYITYATIIAHITTDAMKANTLTSVEYHILLSQYYLCTMNPLAAHREITTASAEMMYFLEKEKQRTAEGTNSEYGLGSKRQVVDRLFWTCLKLECELRAELSPYVPLSGITQMTPPSSFLKIPDPLLENEHLPAAIRLANKYDNHYPWSFFLTEIAVRKVDNKLYDEIYSSDSVRAGLWNLKEFGERKVWSTTIKYLNQYNSIINSLSPQIRNFVLLEADVEQIYASMKKRADKKKKDETEEESINDNLEDFLIDEDLLLRAQSESVMFIKTRFITSKLAMFRPLMYLFLEGKIKFEEVVEAAAAVLPTIQLSQLDKAIFLEHSEESPLHSTTSSSINNDNTDSSSNFTNIAANFLGEDLSIFDMKDSKVSHSFQKKFPDDDFTDLIEFTDGCDEFDENFIQVKDYDEARKRLLRVFVRNFMSLPKLNIPKIGLHRHAGSYYYIRNLTMGAILQYLLYKKVQEEVVKMMTKMSQQEPLTVPMDILEALNTIFSRDSIKLTLEHSLLIINYWKKERPDCVVYYDYVQRCLDRL